MSAPAHLSKCLCVQTGLLMAQKQRVSEKNDLEFFLDLFELIDQSVCEYTDEPDLLVRFNGEMIGIEHTRIYREDPTLPSGSQLLPQEKLQIQLAQRAHQIFREHSDQLLNLNLFFNEPFNYKKSDIEKQAQRLALSVRESLAYFPDASATHSLVQVESWQAQRLRLPFPEGINRYWYTVEQNPGFELWWPGYGCAVPHLSPQQIDKIIIKKRSVLRVIAGDVIKFGYL